MSLLAVKRVGNDFRSAFLGGVAPGGLWSPTLDSSYALTYTVGSTVTATQMAPTSNMCETRGAAPSFSAFATFAGDDYPSEFFSGVKSYFGGGLGGVNSSNTWIIELEFDEADLVRTCRGPGPYRLHCWIAEATVTRRFSRSDPLGSDGYDVFTDQDAADYIVPEVF